MSLLKRIGVSLRYRSQNITFGVMARRRAQRYLERNQLLPLVDEAREVLDATGADNSDYALLHSFVRTRRPKYVLECGTGLTTWVIADALKRNWEEDRTSGQIPVVVSVEDHPDWMSQAMAGLPEKFREHVVFHRTSRTYDHYTFIFGVRYADVPDHPYEMVWLDGPVSRYSEGEFDWDNEDFEHTSVIQVVELLKNNDVPVTVLIDNAKRSQIAYSCVLRRNKVRTYPFWSDVGVLDSVTKDDLIANDPRYIPNFQKIVPRAWPWQRPSFMQ